MGEKRTLRAVARYADHCNFSLHEELDRKPGVLKEHCRNEGRDFNEIGKSFMASGWPRVFVSEEEEQIEEQWESRAKFLGISINEAKERATAKAPGSWVGYPEEVIERFEYLIGFGFDFFQVAFPGLGSDYIEASRKFSELVIQKL